MIHHLIECVCVCCDVKGELLFHTIIDYLGLSQCHASKPLVSRMACGPAGTMISIDCGHHRLHMLSKDQRKVIEDI